MHVWSRGDDCLAPFDNDGKLYRAKIQSIKRDDAGIKATVKYQGYGSDCEDIPVTSLKPVPDAKNRSAPEVIQIPDDDSQNAGLFQPLRQDEVQQQLERRFAGLDSESDNEGTVHTSKKTTASAAVKPRKKGVVATGGKSLPRTPKRKSESKRESSCTSTSSKKKSENHSSTAGDLEKFKKNGAKCLVNSEHQTDNAHCEVEDIELGLHQHSSDGEAFSEEDLEKPKFSFPARAAKVPYILSDENKKPVIQVPATMNRYLRDYQREGVKFLYINYKTGRGALLGDDMGLGKTVQVIGFMSAILGKQGNRLDVLRQRPKFIRELSDSKEVLSKLDEYPNRPFLIIGPGSVLYNWMDELETWGYFNVGKFHGPDKMDCLEDLKRRKKYDVVVTTYETFRENVEDLNSIEWLAVIADEVHRIKGLKAQVTKSLRKMHCKLRYGLTGTALQNNMAEVWSLLDWVQPGSLGSLESFRKDFILPIEHGQKSDSTKRELAQARKVKEKFSQIRKKMMLRRTKMLIADQLPVKDDNVVFCTLSDLQVSVYKFVLDQPDIKFVMSADEPCSCGSDKMQKNCCNESPEGESMNAMKFCFMHLLLKTANHVALLLPSNDSNLSEYTKKICRMISQKFPEFFTQTKEAAFRTLSDPKYCGKMKVLRGLLKVFYNDHSKVLIFSYSTKVLDIIEQYLMTTGYEYRRLDGSTSMKQRMVLVREFNNQPNIFVFLISTKAGGLGLNLTGANRVIVFDPSWNPTNDLQAQDRAYRIGQRRDVHVYRLLSAGTIEENMYLRQIYKQQLDSVVVSSENARRYFKAVQGNKHMEGELFGIKNMLQLREDSCLTLEILERNEKLEASLANFDITRYIPPVTAPEKSAESGEDQDGEKMDTSTDSEIKSDREQFYADLFDLPGTSPVKSVDSEGYDSPDAMENPMEKDLDSTKHATKGTTSEPVPGPSRVVHRATPRGKYDRKMKSSMDQSFTNVKSVFESCGVVHTHKNKHVVGGSKAEDHMSRCAVQDVYELHQNSQAPAVMCEPMSESSEDEAVPVVRGRRRKTPRKDDCENNPRTEIVGNYRVLLGQTPNAIRRKHFEAMSESESSETLVAFAEYVLRCTPSGRRSILESFYSRRNPEFQELFRQKDAPPIEEMASKEKRKETRKVKKGSFCETKNLRQRKATKKKSQVNETLGVTFCDISDDDTQESLKARKGITRLSSKEESLGIGNRKTSDRTKIKSKVVTKFDRSKGKTGPIYIESCDTVNNSDAPLKIKEYSVKESETRKGRKRQILEMSSDQLLAEMGQQDSSEEGHIDNMVSCMKHEASGNQKPFNQHKTKANTSILDDIFGASPEKRQQRKPPPGNRKRRKTGEDTGYESRDLFSDSSTATSSQEEDNVLANVSTLKDEMVDCFTDPPTSRKQKQNSSKIVNKLLSESEDEYQKLFDSGKMRRKPRVIVSIDSDIEPGSNRTPSLF